MAKRLGKIVAENLRRLRKERGLSQMELAGLVGIDKNYVGMIERCESSPTVDMLERLASALKINSIQFFE